MSALADDQSFNVGLLPPTRICDLRAHDPRPTEASHPHNVATTLNFEWMKNDGPALNARLDRPVAVERRTRVTDETRPGRVVQQVVPLANPNPGVERVAR